MFEREGRVDNSILCSESMFYDEGTLIKMEAYYRWKNKTQIILILSSFLIIIGTLFFLSTIFYIY